MKPQKQREPTPEQSYDDEDQASPYDDESDPDEKAFQKNKGKTSTYQPKAKKAEAKNMIQQQNAQVVQSKVKETPAPVEVEEPKVEKGKKMQKVLGKKKTIKDNKGDEWEVVDKRETVIIQKEINSDSESGSELSYD